MRTDGHTTTAYEYRASTASRGKNRPLWKKQYNFDQTEEFCTLRDSEVTSVRRGGKVFSSEFCLPTVIEIYLFF